MQSFKRFAVAAALLATSWAHALTLAPYSAEALAKAQTEGVPVALHFHADWCSTCKAQDKVLDSLKAEPDLNVLVLAVDYDKESALKRQLKVRTQSTFIVYRGKAEVARQSGETSVAGVRALLRKAL